VLTDDRRTVAHAKIDRLARGGLDTVTFWREATEVLRSVVRFDFHPCWFTVDPEHLLITGHFNAGLSETPMEIVHGQYAEDDVNAFADLARRRSPAATVFAATHGDPASSWRWRHLLTPTGFDDALDSALRVGDTTWGAVSLLHTSEQPPFSDADVQFVAGISAALATGTRLGLLLTGMKTPVQASPPAVLIVTADMSLITATVTAGEWLEDLPDTGPYRDGHLPMPVEVAVLRAAAVPGGQTSMRLRARSGRWVQIRTAALTGPSDGQFAVVIEQAQQSDLTPLFLHAYALTAREREVVELVLKGRSTEQIASALFISPYTVQDRLKAVFEKLGVRSRRDLVARIHGEQYQPLIDDNDARLRSGQALNSR
jgi:DNA-binding CsgD family transcriptional regulator